MNKIPTQIENPKGLHQRYVIRKLKREVFADGMIVEKEHIIEVPVDPNAEYFVLRLDDGGSDPIHIDACRKAVLHYADLIKDHLPDLSKDLIERYSFLRSNRKQNEVGEVKLLTRCTNKNCEWCKGTGEVKAIASTVGKAYYHECYGSEWAGTAHREESLGQIPMTKLEFSFGEWVLIDGVKEGQIVDFFGDGIYTVDVKGIWERCKSDRITKKQ